MAAPSYKVPSFAVAPGDEVVEYLLPATAATYYPGEMIGMDTAGYAVKCADAASVFFLGLNAESVDITVLSTDSAGDKRIKVRRPSQGFAMYIASAAITDVSKKCYAAFSNEVQYTTGTYGNYVGTVKEYLSATMVLIRPPGWGEKPVGVSRVLAATGAQTITKWDLNKTMFCANTATLTLTLPAIADTQAGDTLTFVKNHASDTNAITLDGNASETIDGSTTLATLDAAYDTAILVSDGAKWAVLARDIA